MTFGYIIAVFIAGAIVGAIDYFLRKHSKLYKERMEEIAGSDDNSGEEKGS